MVNLAVLTFKLFITLKYSLNASKAEEKKNHPLVKCLQCVPCVLLLLGYFFDSNEQDNENAVLNITRHAFSYAPNPNPPPCDPCPGP
jgi:hypothetical protein